MDPLSIDRRAPRIDDIKAHSRTSPLPPRTSQTTTQPGSTLHADPGADFSADRQSWRPSPFGRAEPMIAPHPKRSRTFSRKQSPTTQPSILASPSCMRALSSSSMLSCAKARTTRASLMMRAIIRWRGRPTWPGVRGTRRLLFLSTPFHKYGDVSRGATRGGMTGSPSTKGMHHAKEKPIRNPTYQAGASRIDGAERWPGSSEQRFGSDRWLPGRWSPLIAISGHRVGRA
jgi:hypothetical protein